MKINLLFAPLTALFLVLNALGGIVSAIWLAIIGEWWAIGMGIVGLFVSHIAIGILIMPGMLIGIPSAALLEKGRLGLGTFLAGISSLYTSAVIGAWGSAVLVFFAMRATPDSVVPLLILSYGVATGPVAFLASKDQQAGGNEYSAMLTFFFQVGYVAAVIVLLTNGTLWFAIGSLAAAMAINWLLLMFVFRQELRVEALGEARGSSD